MHNFVIFTSSKYLFVELITPTDDMLLLTEHIVQAEGHLFIENLIVLAVPVIPKHLIEAEGVYFYYGEVAERWIHPMFNK